MISPEDAAALHNCCRDGSERERAAAYRRLGALLLAVARQRIGPDPRLVHLAEDCAQETLVIVWQRLAAGKGPVRPHSFVSWAMVILSNRIREEIRRLRTTAVVREARRIPFDRLESLDTCMHQGRELAEVLPDPNSGQAEADLVREEVLRILELVVSSRGVSEQSKTVLLRGYIGDWEDADLASFLGTTKSNVHVIRCRDLQKLRECPGLVEELRELHL